MHMFAKNMTPYGVTIATIKKCCVTNVENLSQKLTLPQKVNSKFPRNFLTKKSGKKYHSDCFTCGSCTKELGSNYYDVEGVFQCENCYQNSIGRCDTCGNALQNQFVKFQDLKFHEKCFVCFGCKTPLEDDFYNLNGKPGCYDCASKA